MPCRSRLRGGVAIALLWTGLSASEASVTHYVSFGMPDALLKQHMREAGRHRDQRVVFRGLPESMGYPGFIRTLMPLIEAIPRHQRPSIGIDPAAFDHAGIVKVPVTEEDGRKDERAAKYPVTEPDPRIRMREKLRRISLFEWRAALMRKPSTPETAVFPRATESSNHRIEPSFHLPRSLENAEGRVLVKAGATANPLMEVPMGISLLVMAIGDSKTIDAAQARYQALQGNAQLLVAGVNPGAPDPRLESLSQEFKAPVYPIPLRWIDQLKITGLPAEVRSVGTVLEVRQWPP